jgi:hypothetical protein
MHGPAPKQPRYAAGCAGISFRGEPPELTSYEKASAFFIFLNMLLAGLATVFGG